MSIEVLEMLWEDSRNSEPVECYSDEEEYEFDFEESDWDDLECGFNPYEGCYDWDC